MNKLILLCVLFATSAYSQGLWTGWKRTLNDPSSVVVDSTSITDGTVSPSDLRTAAVTADKLASSGVTAGSYTATNLTVDVDGRITTASSGTATVGQTAQDSTGFQDDGTHIRLVTTSDSVFIGRALGGAGKLEVNFTDAGTTSITDNLAIVHESSGTPAANFGAALRFLLDSNTGDRRDAGRIFTRWTTATDASRASKMVFLTVTAGGSLTRTLQLTNAGARIGSTDSDPSERLHVEGNVLKDDKIDLFANVWTATASNGAAAGSVSYIPTYDFDTTTAETLTVDWRIPSYFSSIDSMQLEMACATPAGDSASFKIQHRDVASTEAFIGAFGDTQTFIKDLGSTANTRIIASMTTALTGIVGDDRIIFKLYRDPSIANDVGTDVKLVALYIYGKGLK